MAKVILRENESFDSLMKRFKKKVQDDGIAQELKRREYYLSPSQKRKRKSELAEARRRKQESKMKVDTLDDSYSY